MRCFCWVFFCCRLNMGCRLALCALCGGGGCAMVVVCQRMYVLHCTRISMHLNFASACWFRLGKDSQG